MLPSIVGEAIAGFALASVIVALGALLARARRQRADAERTIAFERELASDLLEQADALDRLVAAVAGLADDLDEQRVLDRIASATRQLLRRRRRARRRAERGRPARVRGARRRRRGARCRRP